MKSYWYFGELISRNANPYGLMWQCYCDGSFIYADDTGDIGVNVKAWRKARNLGALLNKG